MNRVEKGDIFETKSLEIITKLIEEGTLYLSKDQIKISPKAKYFSRDRNKDIIFDLTIEVWPPEADKYSMIYIIECKNFKNRVPVNKVEDFYSKIQQVTGVNVKGIFITNSVLQESAFNFANSKGIMVIHGDSVDNAKVVLFKRSKAEIDYIKIPYIKETLNLEQLEEGTALITNIIDKNIFAALSEEMPDVSYNIDKLSKEAIEDIANRELDKINTDILINGEGISVKIITDYLLKEYDIKVERFSLTSPYLGSCNIDKKIIKIHPTVINTNRHLFILCHEFGHFLIHQKLMIDQISYDSFEDSNYNFQTGKHELNNPKHWIEWQANYFSICLILNKFSLLACIFGCQIKMGLPKSNIVVNDTYSSQKDFHKILNDIVFKFNTSKTSIIYRMKELKFLTEMFRTKSVGQLIAEYKENYFA